MLREERTSLIGKIVQKMIFERNTGKGRLKKIWENCISKNLSPERGNLRGGVVQNRTVWRRLGYCHWQ